MCMFLSCTERAKYAQYVFRMFDEDRDGIVNFEVNVLQSLSHQHAH